MSRDFVIPGPCMVYVKGSDDSGFDERTELGLAEGEIRVVPNLRHRRLLTNDYGPEVAADVLWMLADVKISMVLVHYDTTLLDFCLWQSMGGRNPNNLMPAGTPLGGNRALPSKANYISLNISPTGPDAPDPYRFPAAYLTGPAATFPLGVERSAVLVEWQAIPYRQVSVGSDLMPQELTSDGAQLYLRTLDAAPAA